MGMLYMTIYTAVQVGLHGTLSSSWTTERGPRREMAKGNVPGGNICSLWTEDDGLCWGVLGRTASCNFYQFKVSICTHYFRDLIYCQSLMIQILLQVPDWHLYFLARYCHLDSWVAPWSNTSHYVSKLIHLSPQVCRAVQRRGAEAQGSCLHVNSTSLCLTQSPLLPERDKTSHHRVFWGCKGITEYPKNLSVVLALIALDVYMLQCFQKPIT